MRTVPRVLPLQESCAPGGELAAHTSVYFCLVCGPILREEWPGGNMTIHYDLPHPEHLTFDEEERPQ